MIEKHTNPLKNKYYKYDIIDKKNKYLKYI